MNINVISQIQQLEKSVILFPLSSFSEELHTSEISISKEILSVQKEKYYVINHNTITFVLINIDNDFSYKNIKNLYRKVSYHLRDLLQENIQCIIPENWNEINVQAAFNGIFLGTYSLDLLKTEKKNQHKLLDNSFQISLITTTNNYKEFAEKGMKIAISQIETMRLVDLPSNICTPTYIAEKCKELEKFSSIKTTIISKEEAEKLNLKAFLSVAKASTEPPKFIIIEYKNPNATQNIGLVGKGITFDTGGLNIKTQGMYFMKSDMSGAAVVYGAMHALASLQTEINVTAILPCAENSVSGNSYKPSDVIQSYSGKTIEITDTDAEGRIVLADGISYLLKNYQVNTILDVATLTGSAVQTFGYECAALFSNNDELAQKLIISSEKTNEKLWRMPLWKEYETDIKSDIADVKHYHQKPTAGAINGAKFLEFFTENHNSWAHLDIAGVSFCDSEFGKNKSATAFGVHLLINFVENI